MWGKKSGTPCPGRKRQKSAEQSKQVGQKRKKKKSTKWVKDYDSLWGRRLERRDGIQKGGGGKIRYINMCTEKRSKKMS